VASVLRKIERERPRTRSAETKRASRLREALRSLRWGTIPSTETAPPPPRRPPARRRPPTTAPTPGRRRPGRRAARRTRAC